ncbi:Hint domain-containing protein [Aliiroseovarius crassostreae]|uniref:Hedgehog/Intein (Hint) domain-containing protein n=1 Tax=Aliiroseovarius crassostreae TaxID=154981 RepID=A0A0P7IF22_9RHOB|nr:Hint domain-containing protein [Aliiroseovarius crassostreae]KPN62556.1 hypothetical protein AKJ29_10100 [Aliiroseovarius crassostreae]SFU96880.1 Hint domain-containing protein [Aliiroseovarius crassostreae]
MVLLRNTGRFVENELSYLDVLQTHGEPISSVSRASEKFSTSGLSCNTPVKTARGTVLARDLRAGDLVKTKDHGFQPLRWIGRSRHAARDAALVRVLNENHSRSQMLMTADHLVLFNSAHAELLFGKSEVLCPARGLAVSNRLELENSATPTLCHLLFDGFELIHAGDFWVESLVPDIARIKAVSPDFASEIIAALPRLAHDQSIANYLQDRIVLDEREAGVLVQLEQDRC